MPNVVLTIGESYVEVAFNDLSAIVGMSKGSWRLTEIGSIQDKIDFIEINVAHGHRWTVRPSATESGSALLIDSINGAEIVSHSQLYTALSALL